MNLGSVLPTGTPADVLTTLANANHPRSDVSKLENYLTPSLAIALRAATGTNQYGANKGSTLANLFGSFAATTPELAFIEGLRATPGSQSNRMYPKTKRDAILQAIFGSAAPRTLNVPVAAKHAQQGQ